jgi:glucose/arabinose dehydrogenase
MSTHAWSRTRPSRRIRRENPARANRRLQLEKLEDRLALAADFLYVGDASSTGDTVQRFDATTGEYLGSFVAAGSLLGPRGLVFDATGNLLAVNQNVGQPFAGEVLRFDGKTGAPLPAPVPSSNPQAPFAPRGIVIRDNTLYVADINEGAPSGRIAKYNATTGAFLGNLVPNGFSGEFSPRGLVFGPDGALYVSVFNQTLHDTNDPAGYVLRFQDTTSGAFQVVAGNNGDGAFQAGEIADLHNPEGIVFGPDGRLYVTSDRANFSDTDKILVLDPQAHSLKDKIVLDQVGQERTYAQSILFGPNGKLFVSIRGDVSGSVRRYDVTTKAFDVFVAPGFYGPLVSPWYMNFGQTDPATLAYRTPSANSSPVLYVGDQGDPTNPNDDTVKRFDATTGEYLGVLVGPGTLVGPRGMVFANPETLLVVNQNVDLPKAGSVLRFDSNTGALLGELIPETDANAPFAPRGIVVQDRTLYAADFAQGSLGGRIAKYDVTSGAFLGNLVPNGFKAAFRPRGIVFGPDSQLYVSVFGLSATDESNPRAGYILRFNPVSGAFTVVAANDGDGIQEPGEVADLHAPEGLVFGPDGRLYVTSFRADANDTDKILVLDSATGALVDKILLDEAGQPRAFAQGLVFGPNGRLFVPITGDGPDTGSVRRYDVTAKTFDVFVKSAASGGPLVSPWYLNLGQTRQDTMAYDTEWNPWHNAANPRDVDGRNGVEPLDVLLIINYINASNSRWPEPPTSQTVPPRYYDVSGGTARADIDPLDVVMVINYLNRSPVATGEGESVSAAVPVLFPQLAVAAPASAPVPSVNWADQTTAPSPTTREPARQANDQPTANPATPFPAASGLLIPPSLSLPADQVRTDDATGVLDDVAWWEDPALLSGLAGDVDRVWQFA